MTETELKEILDKHGLWLRGAFLRDANLSFADLRGGVPVVENVHAKILAAIEAGGTLDMWTWHTCATTHCRAGWTRLESYWCPHIKATSQVPL